MCHIHKKTFIQYRTSMITFPKALSPSFKNLEAKMAETKTLKAPNGVTIDAGAKV